MAIDQIHDVQNVYRKILHSMSRPGTISNLESLISEVNVKLPCYPAVFLAAVTLLDAEVTFHVIGGQDKRFAHAATQRQRDGHSFGVKGRRCWGSSGSARPRRAVSTSSAARRSSTSRAPSRR